MLIAQNKEGELIYAAQLQQQVQENLYFCPKCKQKLFVKKSSKGKYYFSHINRCSSNQQKRTSKETQEHQNGKTILFSALSNIVQTVEVEYHYPMINQFADVAVVGDGDILYEFQRSVIPSAQVVKRQRDYLRCVNKVCWLMDYQTAYKKPFIQPFKRSLLNYNSNLGIHCYYLDLKARDIVIDYNIPLVYSLNNYQYQTLRLPIKEFHLNHYSAGNTYTQTIKRAPKRTKHRNLIIAKFGKTYQKEIFELYQEGIILNNLPQWIFIYEWVSPLLAMPVWLALSWIIAIGKQRDCFTLEALEENIRSSNRLNIVEFPLIDEDIHPTIIYRLVKLLIEHGTLIKKEKGMWYVNN